MQYKQYKKEMGFSYALGAFPTVELLKNNPDKCVRVIASSRLNETKDSEVFKLCVARGISFVTDDKTVARISPKENIYVIGVFEKYDCVLNGERPHIVLDNPGNMGNLGTILRTCAGFGICDAAIIPPGVDIFDPKVVRASMGAIFGMNVSYVPDIGEYRKRFAVHELYTFMLDGKARINNINVTGKPYSLIFGNEATGLSQSYSGVGTSVVIPHDSTIDSLNITVAVGVAAQYFYNVASALKLE